MPFAQYTINDEAFYYPYSKKRPKDGIVIGDAWRLENGFSPTFGLCSRCA